MMTSFDVIISDRGSRLGYLGFEKSTRVEGLTDHVSYFPDLSCSWLATNRNTRFG